MNLIRKIFDPSNLIITLPILFVLFLVLMNGSSIMERFGFETRASVKSELVRVQKNLDLAKEQIKRLEQLSIKNKLVCDLKEDVSLKFTNKNDVIDKMIKELNLDQYLENKKKKEEELTKEDLTSIDPPPIEIVSIHEAYNVFYGS